MKRVLLTSAIVFLMLAGVFAQGRAEAVVPHGAAAMHRYAAGTCGDCDGRGKRTCGWCGGDGIRNGKQCTFCNGRGTIKCLKCGGSGKS